MDELKPFNSKSVTYTYIGYTEHNSRGQPIVWRPWHKLWIVKNDLDEKRPTYFCTDLFEAMQDN